jgi:hypothetical protein
MRPVETIPGTGVRGIKEDDGGVNSTMIYSKNFHKCHNVPSVKHNEKILLLKNKHTESLSTQTSPSSQCTVQGNIVVVRVRLYHRFKT